MPVEVVNIDRLPKWLEKAMIPETSKTQDPMRHCNQVVTEPCPAGHLGLGLRWVALEPLSWSIRHSLAPVAPSPFWSTGSLSKVSSRAVVCVDFPALSPMWHFGGKILVLYSCPAETPMHLTSWGIRRRQEAAGKMSVPTLLQKPYAHLSAVPLAMPPRNVEFLLPSHTVQAQREIYQEFQLLSGSFPNKRLLKRVLSPCTLPTFYEPLLPAP
jgi:hypothetical protein